MSHRTRAAFHPRPQRGWMNDPNGAIHFEGRYHLFFQYNPDSVRAESIRWGHMSSPDLLSWTEHPIALTPRPGELDAAGCWSGVTWRRGEQVHAFYSGVTDRSGLAQVAHATAGDAELVNWAADRDAIVPVPQRDGLRGIRDPFLFSAFGRDWAIQGAGVSDGPILTLYEVRDVRDWILVGDLLAGHDLAEAFDMEADIWECPQLVPLGDHWLLLVSRWSNQDGTRSLNGTRGVVGQLRQNGDGLNFLPEDAVTIDRSDLFYAAHVLPEVSRTLVWGWCREPDVPSIDLEWAGLLSVPRELFWNGGRIVIQPASEMTRLRIGEARDVGTPAAEGKRRHKLKAPTEVIVRTETGATTRLQVLTDEEVAWAESIEGREEARILVDHTVCEIFLDAGGAATTIRTTEDAVLVLQADVSGSMAEYSLRPMTYLQPD